MNTTYIELDDIELAVDYEADSYEEIDVVAIRPYDLDADFMPILQKRIIDLCHSRAERDYSDVQADAADFSADSMREEKMLDDRDRAAAMNEQLT